MMINKDIRDTQKIKSLLLDLKKVANEMLEQKFKLSKQGEVTKPRKIYDAFEDKCNATMDISEWQMTTTVSAGTSLTLSDLRRAHEMLRNNKPTEYGLTAGQWWVLVTTDPQARKNCFRPELQFYEITFEGVHTSQTYHQTIGANLLANSQNPIDIIKHLQQVVQHKLVEPTIIKDPRERRSW